MAIDRLTFVYDADGTVVGELRYWFSTLLGAEHCSLCDITHSRWGKRSEFNACALRLELPITYLHRNDLTDELDRIVARLPAVIGHDGESTAVLLDGPALDQLHGDVAAFETVLRSAIGSAAHRAGTDATSD